MKKLKRILSLVLAVCILSGMNTLHIGGNTAAAETLTSQAESSISEALNVADNAEASVQPTEQLVNELKENSNITDYVDEKTLIDSKHVKRLKDKEKLNTYVFLNEDGTESVYYMEKNVKYKADNGKIHEKDITLVHKDKAYKVTDSDVKLSIPDTAADGIELGYKENNVKLVPENSKSKANATLNETDNSVTYKNYFGSGTDLRYTPLLSGIKEDIILSSYTENNSFEFTLYTNGLKIFSDQGSYYLAESADSEDKIYLGEIIVYDAVGRPDKGTLTIETVKESSEYLLIVSADEDFLKDPLTVYPVVIDPTLEVSQNIQGINTIVEATVFSGFPDQNFGDYAYCTLGQINAGYGIARTIVRFEGLSNDAVYNSITSTDITSAKFYVKEAAGAAAHNVSVLYNQSTTAWTETDITWNTLSTQLSDPIASANLNNNEWSYFDLTDYVKRCRAGELTLTSGLVLKLTSNETLSYTQFDTSEHETAGFRPYLVLTYTGDTSISLNAASIDVDEGGTYELIATTNPSDADVIWSSDDKSIARVSTNGIIHARKAGVTRITATIKGTNVKKYCKVFVTVPDGIYVISNMDTGKVLDAENNGIADNTNVLLCPKNSYCGGINQIWRIKHLAQGYYSVRPLHKLDMCLYTDGSGVTIYESDLDETIDNTPDAKRWTITYEVIEGTTDKGYVFKGLGKALTIGDMITSNDYDATVSTRDLTDSSQYWTLTPDDSASIRGTRMYDSSRTGAFYDSNYHLADMFVRNIVAENVSSLASLQLVPAYYSNVISDSVLQTFQWSSSDTSVASVDSQSGTVTAHSLGTANITAGKTVNGAVYRSSFTVSVCSGNSVTIEIVEDSVELPVNDSKSLDIDLVPDGLEVEWSSSDESVATVSSNGIVNAKRAGYAQITAEIKSTGVFDRCTVYVVIPDGTYVITNMSNDKVLDAENNGILNKTDVLLCSPNNYCGALNQKWQIKYVGGGLYSVNPVHKLDMYLYSDEKTATIYECGYNDKNWSIFYELIGSTNEMGVVFKCGDEVLSFCDIPDSNNSRTIMDLYDATDRKQFWELTEIDDVKRGVRLYDMSNAGVFYDSNYRQDQVLTKNIIIGRYCNYEDLNLAPIFYSYSTTDNANRYFQLTTSNSDVVGLMNYVNLNAKKYGEATITGTCSYDSSTYTFSFNLLAVSIEEGVYYIQNRQSELYAQLDNNASPDYDESGITLEQFDFAAGDYQKWSFELLDGGYYKIISVQSGMALSVKAGDVSEDNVALVQQSYTGDYRQQWNVTKTANGSYKIKARSSEGLADDLVMAIGTGIIASQGINVEQRIYLDNDSYKDEWYLVGIKGLTFVSVPDDGKDSYVHYHDFAFEDALADLNGMGYLTNKILNDPSGKEIVDCMTQSEIFFYRGHGEKDNLDLTHGKEEVATYFDSLDDNAFSQCKLVLYAACNVGMGRETVGNLVSATHAKGAQTVVGFDTTVHCVVVNIWSNAFFDGLAMGKNVQDACTYADEFIMAYYDVSDNDKDSTRIVGYVDNSFYIPDLEDLDDERIIRARHIIGDKGVVGHSFIAGSTSQVIKLY